MCDLEAMGVPSILIFIRSVVVLTMMLSTEFRFELGVEHHTVKMKHVVVCLCKLNS